MMIRVRTNTKGAYTIKFTVPTTAQAGTHVITVKAENKSTVLTKMTVTMGGAQPTTAPTTATDRDADHGPHDRADRDADHGADIDADDRPDRDTDRRTDGAAPAPARQPRRRALQRQLCRLVADERRCMERAEGPGRQGDRQPEHQRPG